MRRRSVDGMGGQGRGQGRAAKRERMAGSRMLSVLLVVAIVFGTIGMKVVGDALSDAPTDRATAAQKYFIRSHVTTTASQSESGQLAPVNDTAPPERRRYNVSMSTETPPEQPSVAATLAPDSPHPPSTEPALSEEPPVAQPTAQPTAESTPVASEELSPVMNVEATAGDTFVTRGPDFDHSVSREQGIILSLYNAAIPMGVSLIRELRCLGNLELIQVYHCFPEELTPESKAMLFAHDTRIEIIDLCSELVHSGALTTALARKFKNWWLKPLALHHTDLKHVLLLDADDFVLQNPALVRNTTAYRANGTVFFFDRVIPCNLYLSKRVPGHPLKTYLRQLLDTFDYAAFGVAGDGARPSQRLLNSMIYHSKSCHEMDSSMVAIDKSRAGKALDVLWWLVTKERLRYDFSWGDKEAFWLAYELAHEPYAFSPWAVSVVASSPNEDMAKHPDTLCGSIAQYVPEKDETPQLLYVNGRALLEPFPQGLDNKKPTPNILHNANPSHLTPRQQRHEVRPQRGTKYPGECLVGMGATPVPDDFKAKLLRRRVLHGAAMLGVESALSIKCDVFH